MKILVAVIVHNRIENIKRWIKCWKQCEKENTELVIIHNYYGDLQLLEKFKSLCEQNKIKYVPRNGTGFDIGGFQDVCKERLEGFPAFDYLLWCTDDTIPMTKDFTKPFIDEIQKPNVGLSCMQISKSTPGNILHVRTTGFCISKETSLRLTFPTDPIKTKQDCYSFEHRGGKNTLCEQIRAMGLDCVQVSPNQSSPLWDMGYWKRLDRINEHNKVFGFEENNSEKILFICPIYDKYPQIISCLICQSNPNWELLLIDDNPQDVNTKNIVDSYGDQRIKYVKKERVGNYGHPLRQWALEKIREENYGYVCVSNPDNYYTPNFIKEVLLSFKKSHTAVAAYSSKMVHSYKNWDVIPCKLERGYLDCGGVVIKKEIACEVGWSNIVDHSADWIFFQEIANKYSWRNFIPVTGCTFVHN